VLEGLYPRAGAMLSIYGVDGWKKYTTYHFIEFIGLIFEE
jgi:hypothetical protein